MMGGSVHPAAIGLQPNKRLQRPVLRAAAEARRDDGMRGISALRKQYRPEKIEVLIVAESPPDSADEEVRFFYNPRQERWDHMYRSVMKAVSGIPSFQTT
jgi:hypothetical protein